MREPVPADEHPEQKQAEDKSERLTFFGRQAFAYLEPLDKGRKAPRVCLPVFPHNRFPVTVARLMKRRQQESGANAGAVISGLFPPGEAAIVTGNL